VRPRAATAARHGAAVLAALAALAAPAAACPSCSVAQDGDSLLYIAAFLVIPYVLVTGTWLCLRRILASERRAGDGSTP